MAWLAAGICAAAAVLICMPLLMIPGGSLMDGAEMNHILSPILGEGKGFAVWHLIPVYPTMAHFYRLLIESPAFYQLFWNTVGMTAAILAGQLVVGLPSAWAFAAFRFRGRDFLFGLYVVLMLLPFQVMLLPQYIVLQKLHLYNHPAAVILPAIFSTFPVFIMYRGFTQIDAEILEAARLDGAGGIADFYPYRAAAWKDGNTGGYGFELSGILESGGAADGVFGGTGGVAPLSICRRSASGRRDLPLR